MYLCTTDRAKVMTSNTKGLEKAMTKADENFNQATVDLSQCLNHNVAFDYYIGNYDGSVEKKIYMIYVSRPLIKTENVTVTVETQGNTVQTQATKFNETRFMTRFMTINNDI